LHISEEHDPSILKTSVTTLHTSSLSMAWACSSETSASAYSYKISTINPRCENLKTYFVLFAKYYKY
jgi:hypothetical protein